MIGSHKLHHDRRNGGPDRLINLADIVELIETFTGYDVNGLRDPSPGALRLDLEAPIVAAVITDGSARFEGCIEWLSLRVDNGLPATTKEGTDA